MNRRNIIQVGALGTLGITLSDVLRAQEIRNAKIDSVINIFLPGGMAAQESWDPKPFAPSEYRGPYNTVDTNVPGIQLSELFVKVAKVMDKSTIIRSMTHGEAAHERGTHNMFTGWTPSAALKYPSMGSIVAHELGNKGTMPSYISIPNQPNEFGGAGYLSSKYGTFSLGADPAAPGFKVKDLSLPDNITIDRFERRKQLLEVVDSKFKSIEMSDGVTAVDEFYNQAYSLISSTKSIEAFDITKESDKMKEAYGNNQAGQRFLMARRLVEAGARFITVTYGGWDHHDNIKGAMGSNVPALDQGLAQLITDLDQRGMLSRTLVLVTSEFGRTPKINATQGRDHWPRSFSTFLAGGPIKQGYVHGKTTDLGDAVDESPVDPSGISATVFSLLGIEHHKKLITNDLRPIEISPGKIITDIIS